MTRNLAQFVIRHWLLVLLAWVGLLVGIRAIAPDWDSVTEDGDFQYLPERCSSVEGQRLLESRFPSLSTRSQFVVIIGRDQLPAADQDLNAAYDVARRLHLLIAENFLARAAASDDPETRIRLGESAFEQFGAALALTQSLFDKPPESAPVDPPWFAPEGLSPISRCLIGRSQALLLQGKTAEAEAVRSDAIDLDPAAAQEPIEAQARDVVPIEKIWTWRTEGIGSALMDLRDSVAIARLIVLHVDSEFLAVSNVEVFSRIEAELAEVRQWLAAHTDSPPEIGVSGSAAVGSDLLAASAEAVSNTEWTTLLFVTAILAFVYRAPLMILVPLITIAVSLDVALHVLALATQVDQWTGWEWWSFGVFKTTRIFVVVILFGAGTDFCLFLIARTRENSSKGNDRRQAIAESLWQVGPAILASALTTILGLGMMAFAQFGKLNMSGPAIGIALFVTLLACLTLTPALLVGMRSWLFWPGSAPDISATTRHSRTEGLWTKLADFVVKRPVRLLAISLLILTPFAWHGWYQQSHVTYDLLAGLDPERPSRMGTDLLRKHFPIGESGPVIILAQLPNRPELWRETRVSSQVMSDSGTLAVELEELPYVQYVRSPAAPLGHRGNAEGLSQNVIRAMGSVQSLFVAPPTTPPDSQAKGPIVRFDAVLETDAFSPEATDTIDLVLQRLEAHSLNPQSPWYETQFSVAGTTAAVHDLREITVEDTRTIEILTVLAVYLVLVIILRHPLTCLYMILSVVFSYLVTIGISDLLFSWFYGSAYVGLEWKVPLFLFVILVAVGEDYNVYLASRVFEEQREHGLFQGLRIAMSRTGGIISSCGAIMAGTFISMTTPAWHHFVPEWFGPVKQWIQPDGGSLQGMVQMGAALTIGVLLDTFVVRPLLLPAYLSLVARWQFRNRKPA